MTSILSDTFAPPRIATNGRSGRLERVAEILQLLLHQQAGRRPLDVVRDGLDRRVRAVRRAERVVHVEVGERRERLRERRVVLLFLGVEPQVLEQHDAAARGVDLLHRASRLVADAVVGERHRRAEQLGQAIRDRPQAHLRVRLALRAPEMAREHDRRAVRRARTGSSAATRGSACRRRCAPSFSGTLKSTRTKTRLPFEVEIP